ncbi:MAG: SH3 domain-containing protein [Thermomicrobiales bacterium]
MATQFSGVTTRRGFLKSVAGGSAALALLGLSASLPGSASAQSSDSVAALASGHFRTTTALNLRSAASLTASVILVIPNGALVAAAGPEQNGFVKVSYAGNIGWAHGDYLTVSNGGSNDAPVYTGNGYTTDDVNMRTGPGLNHGVIRVLPAGTTVQLFDMYASNYRMVGYAQQHGWVSIDYINPGGSGQQPGYLVATANLNLRSGPSLSASVLKVIPGGAQVARGDEVSNGFRAVTYAGVSGWASTSFLK